MPQRILMHGVCFLCVYRALQVTGKLKNIVVSRVCRIASPFFMPKIKLRKVEQTMKRCWKTWIKAAVVRAVKTVAQTAVATIGTSAVFSQVDWMMVGGASLLAGILSILTSLAGLPECKEGETDESA
jgi:hypothetical protein